MKKRKLKTSIVVAVIGAAATVVAAVIGLIAVLMKKSPEPAPVNNNESGIQVVDPSVGGDQIIVGGDYYAPQTYEPEMHPDKPNLSYNMGNEYKNNFDYSKALEYYMQAAAEYGQTEGPASTNRAMALVNAGGMHYMLSENEKAIECYLEAVAIYKKNYSSENQIAIVGVYAHIGNAYEAQDSHNKALEFYWKALQICIEDHRRILKAHGPEDSFTQTDRGFLEYYYNKANRLEPFDEWYTKEFF